MPVLMNKGTDPRQAAWLFYTDRAVLDEFGAAAAEGRFDAGVLTVDDADLDAAPKPGSEVPVYLAVATLVPEGFDLAGLMGQDAREAAGDAPQGEGARCEAPVGEGGGGNGAGDTGADDAAEAGAADASAGGEQEAGPARTLPYDPVPAPEGTRVLIGTTTAAAARAYIRPREVDGKPWATELPGLPMLVSLIDHMREHGGLPQYAVWHVDAQGVLRMAPAKQVKPMAGNVLKCKR